MQQQRLAEETHIGLEPGEKQLDEQTQLLRERVIDIGREKAEHIASVRQNYSYVDTKTS